MGVPLCSSCGQENPDIARFCLACGVSLEEAPPPSEERRLVTAVFTDLVGSTTRTERLDPEDVHAMLKTYYAHLRREIERFGGTVEKFIGDAVVALFGAPAHEDDPERAVRAALAIREAIRELNESDEWFDLRIRIGVNTGEALMVVGARAAEGEAIAAGDVMNTAARLQTAAPVDGILVGELTYRATRDVIEYRDAEPVAVKGKAEPVFVWEAVGVRDERRPQRPARGPLIGRADELRRLVELWDGVVTSRRPALATVLGPPGIGKSRLLTELAGRAGLALWGRCLPYGEGITYWPVTEIVREAAGILQTDGSELAAARVGALLERLPTSDADELRTIAAALSNLLGAETTPRGTYSAMQISQAELHWGIRRVLQLLARERPLLIVLEDLHWAEPTLLELARFLVDDAEEAPFLVAASARPDLEEWLGRVRIELGPLAEEDAESLLEGLLGPESPAAGAILRRAGGNPLFLEETARMLAEAGTVDVETVQLPASLHALIASRLDRLLPAERQLAQHAAVVGEVFWPGAVAYLHESDGELEPLLASLERRDLVYTRDGSTLAGEREYAFKHILIRDVAYGQLPKGRRAGLHVRFSDWVKALPGAEDEFVEIVAWHLEQACRLAREVARSPVAPPVLDAVATLSGAADKAERREGMREAERFYARALELVGDDYPETAIELQLRSARPLAALGSIRRASERLADVAEKARTLGRLDVRCSALVVLANIDHRQGEAVEARSRLAEAEALAAKTGDRRLQIRTAFALAAVLGDFEGAFEDALERLEHAVSIAEELDDRPLRVEGHLRLGFLLFNEGRLAAAQEQVERCLELAAELGSRRDEARATFLLALIKFGRGDLDESERRATEAGEWLERTGETYFQVQNSGVLAQCALARGDAELAEQHLRTALPLALEEGGWLLIEVYRLLAQTLVEQGRVDDAAELVEFAGRNVPEGYPYAPAALLLARATVAAARRAREEAINCYEEALRLLEAARLPLDLCRARVAFARALAALGDRDAARRQLDGARTACLGLGADGFAAELDRELAALAGGTG